MITFIWDKSVELNVSGSIAEVWWFYQLECAQAQGAKRGESEKNISVLSEHWDRDCVKDQNFMQ